jgi:DNA repair protein REV1
MEASASEMVQKTLAFKTVGEKTRVKVEVKQEKGKQAEKPIIMVQPPSSDADVAMLPPSTPQHTTPKTPKQEPDFDLPSFSQVDRDVLSALPENVRQELTEEYSRRSATPTSETKHLGISDEPNKSPVDDPTDTSPMKTTPTSSRKVTDRGTPLSRITQALAPRNRTSVISPYKSKLFSKRNADPDNNEDGPSTPRVGAVKVTDAELMKLGLDTEVFRLLPRELQSEQLARARFSKSFGDEGRGSKGKGKKRA